MTQESDQRMSGNEAFEGYAIDLIKEIAEILSKKSMVTKKMDVRDL